ncbi:unnamed protein product [Vicia faba]|uniref:Transmembrane protein n=1 Tax=Vicia faba TaxID=3906 RepID=A0AAV1AAL0_VICFA|nr:unnamed protein product [Vicia faba]
MKESSLELVELSRRMKSNDERREKLEKEEEIVFCDISMEVRSMEVTVVWVFWKVHRGFRFVSFRLYRFGINSLCPCELVHNLQVVAHMKIQFVVSCGRENKGVEPVQVERGSGCYCRMVGEGRKTVKAMIIWDCFQHFLAAFGTVIGCCYKAGKWVVCATAVGMIYNNLGQN